jgi:hypothetical protein
MLLISGSVSDYTLLQFDVIGPVYGQQSIPNNPYRNIGSGTIADSVGNTFEPTYSRQQAHLRISQYSASPIHRSMSTIDEPRYGSSLIQQTKLEELKRLVYKYPQYHNYDPDAIVKWASYCSSNGDNKFLDEKLEQLTRLDSYNR